MKKLINEPTRVVREMLEGLVALDPRLAILAQDNVVLRGDLGSPDSRKVAAISGGGAGHEPAHAGYVGPGMLAAAVVGDVFTSPSVDAVLAAIRAAAGPAGALLIVKNYTGDRLNFGLAAELARHEGIPVEIVVVADDCALGDTVPAERRRGIAGTVLVHKIAGAAIEEGLGLERVAQIARQAAGDVRTMGVGLGACIVPAAGRPTFELGEGEIELGLGIHGEKGIRRDTIKPADAIVDEILDVIIADIGPAAGKPLALLVNGLGATPDMELAIVARRAIQGLRERGLEVARAWSGNFMTALEMPGVSLSLMPVDEARTARLDAPTGAAAWGGDGRIPARPVVLAGVAVVEPAVPGKPADAALKQVALAVADALTGAEAHLTDLDSKAGDGDLGASMRRGADALRALPDGAFSAPDALLEALGQALRRAIAGSSGPFYATALLRAAARLRDVPAPEGRDWREAFAAAVAAIGDLGGARAGDRTMLDALLPAVAAWEKAEAAGRPARTAFAEAVAAARAGAEGTAKMTGRLGRSSYLGERVLGVPDGGAVAVATWLQAIADRV